MNKLEIKNLHVDVEGKEILKGVDLTISSGEIHAVMGPNGSGKSTLAMAVAGHPRYEVTEGEVLLDGEDVLEMDPDKRAQAGLFLAFQYPSEVPGVKLFNFLWLSYKAVKGEDISATDFLKRLEKKVEVLDMDKAFLERSINDGFSGGEKKKAEILQMMALEPKFAIMDETDSGLDVDALQIVARGAKSMVEGENPLGVLVITHYQRILQHIEPDHVHVMMDGKIAKSGDKSLAVKLEEEGYGWLEE